MRDAPIDLGSFRRYTWWTLTGTVTVFLVIVVGDWVLDPAVAVWVRALSAVALVVMVVACVVLLSRRLPAEAGATGELPVAWLVAGGAAAAVLGAVALSALNYGLWSIAPATMVSIIATFLPPRQRRTLVAAGVVTAAALGGAVALAVGDPWLFAAAFPALMVASIAWMALGMMWAWDIAERLNHARRLAAELAVKDERLRFAADLHDIQGHHLQVIALKSELAARLADVDPARAAAEMTHVQQLATDALKDTRAVVQGYRRTSLDEEIVNAANVLAAADIDTRMELGQDADTRGLSPTSRHLLGLVMREATTNVLRHSHPRRAEVGYRVADGVASLRVCNDGAADPSGPAAGTGLRTLSERLADAGGTLSWERSGERFELVASLPVDA